MAGIVGGVRLALEGLESTRADAERILSAGEI
jgi:hypothetical protein